MDQRSADIRIRQIEPADAAAFLALCRKLDEETTLMMLEADERSTTVAEQLAAIGEVLASDNSTIIVAYAGGELAGYVAATGGRYRRERHTAYLVAGVAQAHAGRGVGTRLFVALEEWARSAGMHRLELTVQARNVAGQRLYAKMGYRVEGTRADALLIDGQFVDELYMAKLLD